MTRALTISISDELSARLNKHLIEVYGVDKLHGKRSKVGSEALDAYLTEKGY